MKKNPLISIIVPTYNSSNKLSSLFTSLQSSNYNNFEVIINDSVKSKDNTKDIVKSFQKKGMRVFYYQENTSMAQARLQGTKHANGEILLHLDSDMEVTPELLSEVVLLLMKYDALIIPEESFGTTFWAKCKWLEKKCYDGIDQIESARAMKKSVYDSVGGHDKDMIFSEDKDLDLRIRKAGYTIGRTKHILRHNEGNLRLLDTCRKKLSYSHTANLFQTKHPQEARWQANIFNRYVIYWRNSKYLFRYPLLFAGLHILKTTEFSCGLIGYLKGQYFSK